MNINRASILYWYNNIINLEHGVIYVVTNRKHNPFHTMNKIAKYSWLGCIKKQWFWLPKGVILFHNFRCSTHQFFIHCIIPVNILIITNRSVKQFFVYFFFIICVNICPGCWVHPLYLTSTGTLKYQSQFCQGDRGWYVLYYCIFYMKVSLVCYSKI